MDRLEELQAQLAIAETRLDAACLMVEIREATLADIQEEIDEQEAYMRAENGL